MTVLIAVLVLLALFAAAWIHTRLLQTNDNYARFFSDLELSSIEIRLQNPQHFVQGKASYEKIALQLRQWVTHRYGRLHDLQAPALKSRLQRILQQIDTVRHAIAEHRRTCLLNEYYAFSSAQIQPDLATKQALPPAGAFVHFSNPIPLDLFPSFIAGVLKYKKHEWRVVAFEVNKHIPQAWVNKGPDRHSVGLGISYDELVQYALKLRSHCVLDFHNHPNPDPTHLTTLVPSDADLQSAREISSLLGERGIGLIAFVCERGRWLEYFRHIPDAILPVDQFLPPSPHPPELFDVLEDGAFSSLAQKNRNTAPPGCSPSTATKRRS